MEKITKLFDSQASVLSCSRSVAVRIDWGTEDRDSIDGDASCKQPDNLFQTIDKLGRM